MTPTVASFLQEVAAPVVTHIAVPFWNLGTIVAIIAQSAILVRWATRIEARVDSDREKNNETAARYDARLTVLERNGSPAVKTLSQYLDQEQGELQRLLAQVEDNGRTIEALSSRMTRVETVCSMRHAEGKG